MYIIVFVLYIYMYDNDIIVKIGATCKVQRSIQTIISYAFFFFCFAYFFYSIRTYDST